MTATREYDAELDRTCFVYWVEPWTLTELACADGDQVAVVAEAPWASQAQLDECKTQFSVYWQEGENWGLAQGGERVRICMSVQVYEDACELPPVCRLC